MEIELDLHVIFGEILPVSPVKGYQSISSSVLVQLALKFITFKIQYNQGSGVRCLGLHSGYCKLAMR